MRYVKWASSKDCSSSVNERCRLALLDEECVKEDESYLRLWLSHASCVEGDPSWIFRLLDDRGIGRSLSLFWISWAFVSEKNENFGLADEIYSRGTSYDAQPFDLLARRRREFERRMKRRYIEFKTATRSTRTREPFRQLDTQQQQQQIVPETAAKKTISRKLVFSTAAKDKDRTRLLRRADDQDLTINSSIAQRAIDDLFHEDETTYDEATMLAGTGAAGENDDDDDVACQEEEEPRAAFDIFVDEAN